tara:strand:+ start:2631 stop:2798 length:168 start_codon:yes stop_codon:yes gene_type:complete
MNYIYDNPDMKMSKRDIQKQKNMETSIKDMDRIVNHPSYIYDGSNFAIDFPSKDS